MTKPDWSFKDIPLEAKTCDVDNTSSQEDATQVLTTTRRTQPLGLGDLPDLILDKILEKTIERDGRVDELDISVIVPHIEFHGKDKPVFKNGGPWELKVLLGLLHTNRFWRERVQQWLFRTNNHKFVASEYDFHHSPAVLGLENTHQISQLQISFDYCGWNGDERPELLAALVEGFPGLKRLVIRQTSFIYSDGSTAALDELLRDLHGMFKFAAYACLRHPGLNRIVWLPDIAKSDDWRVSSLQLDRGFVNVPGDALAPNWQKWEDDPRIVGPRKTPRILNATVIREMTKESLRNARPQDICIQPGQSQTRNDIVSSEVTVPTTHYSIMHDHGFQISPRPLGFYETELKDGTLLNTCSAADQAPNPLLYVMQEFANLLTRHIPIEQQRRQAEWDRDWAERERREYMKEADRKVEQLRFDMQTANSVLKDICTLSSTRIPGETMSWIQRRNMSRIADISEMNIHRPCEYEDCVQCQEEEGWFEQSDDDDEQDRPQTTWNDEGSVPLDPRLANIIW